jgi:hypothetical protein
MSLFEPRSDSAAPFALACCVHEGHALALPEPGSRRRRLWDLDSAAHCPVLGVCLPIELLRRLVAKALPAHASDDDYRLHCIAVSECKRRAALCEAMHKALEARFAPALRQTAALRSTAALAEAWRERRDDERMPGALWATLTHSRCDTVLESQVLADVHMLQHQLGAAQRVDRARFEALQGENAALRTELEVLRRRSQEQGTALQARLDIAQSRAMQLRAEAIGRDTALAALNDEQQLLQVQAPGLKARAELARRVQEQTERIAELERELRAMQQQAELRELHAPPIAVPAETDAVVAPPVAVPPPVLGDRAVLCVGGRPASVPLYRHIVERSGGRFLHHDGGDEQSVQRLDATLSAADLVICQTGCVSHDAYWRVKEHCKRHGKRCVFIENPGSASLKRALAELQA